MAGKYSAGAIIAAMPFKGGKDAKGGMAPSEGDDSSDKDTPVCTISKDDLKKLEDGETIDYTGEDGTKMKIVVGDDESGESADDEAAEGESADDGMGENE